MGGVVWCGGGMGGVWWGGVVVGWGGVGWGGVVVGCGEVGCGVVWCMRTGANWSVVL